MLDYGFDSYESLCLADAGELEYAISVSGGEQNTVLASNPCDVRVTLPRERGEIAVSTELSRIAEAPVQRGDTLGRVVWECDGKEIASADICAEFNAAKSKKSEKFSLWRWFLSLFGLKI